MTSAPPNPIEAASLPEPLASLSYRELILRLNQNIEPDDRFHAQLLVHRFFELARKWESHQPSTSASIYRGALEAISRDGFFAPATQILEKAESNEAGIQSAALALVWLLNGLKTVPSGKLALLISVSSLLVEVFDEEKAP